MKATTPSDSQQEAGNDQPQASDDHEPSKVRPTDSGLPFLLMSIERSAERLQPFRGKSKSSELSLDELRQAAATASELSGLASRLEHFLSRRIDDRIYTIRLTK